jgi:hypothetical protein
MNPPSPRIEHGVGSRARAIEEEADAGRAQLRHQEIAAGAFDHGRRGVAPFRGGRQRLRLDQRPQRLDDRDRGSHAEARARHAGNEVPPRKALAQIVVD